MNDFVSYTNTATLPHTSERVKKLTHAVCEMIARDIRPINIVDDAGFLNLLKVAEPRYAVPCRSTILRNLSDLYTTEKRRIYGIAASADYLCCTTDMWSSRTGDGYISLTCHFLNSKCAVIIWKLIIFQGSMILILFLRLLKQLLMSGAYV